VERTTAWRAAIVAVAIALLWRIVAVNAIIYDQAGRPSLPAFNGRADVAAAIRDNPADPGLLLGLARADARAGDDAAVRKDLAAATTIAPAEQSVLEAEASALLSQRRNAEAAARLSRIATTFGNYGRIFPVFARMLAAQDPALQAIAAGNPPWLGAFILDQCGKGTDPRMLAPLLQQRVTAASRPDPSEIECVTEKLRDAGRWAEAYQAWLNTLPKERLSNVGFIFNGSFEYPASGVGFDWKPDRIPERDSGHAVEFAASREGHGSRALRIVYTGKRQTAPALVEYLAVPAGRYELTGRAKVQHLAGPRGLRWVLRCAADPKLAVIGASERFLGSGDWESFAFDVDIAPGCAGQLLRLEPVGLEEGTTFLSGSAWFDDMALAVRR